jgi:hypothetical protein
MDNGHWAIRDVALDQLRQVKGLILGLVGGTEARQVYVDAQR